jgi:hypothetical protein
MQEAAEKAKAAEKVKTAEKVKVAPYPTQPPDYGEAEAHIDLYVGHISKLRELPSHTQREVCFNLMEIASGPQKLKIFRANGCPALMFVMAKNHLDTQLVTAVIGTFAEMAKGTEPKLKEQMASEGVLTAVMGAMQEHADRVELNMHGMACLGYMAFLVPSNQASIIEQKGHLLMLKQLKRYMSHKKLQRHAAVALSRVVSDSKTQADLGATAARVAPVTASMELHIDDVTVQIHFCKYLQKLCTQYDGVGRQTECETVQRVVIECDGADQILNAMKAHPTSNELQKEALCALATIVLECADIQDAVADKGGIEAAIAAAELDPTCARWACTLLSRLARQNIRNQKLIHASGGVQTIVAAMEKANQEAENARVKAISRFRVGSSHDVLQAAKKSIFKPAESPLARQTTGAGTTEQRSKLKQKLAVMRNQGAIEMNVAAGEVGEVCREAADCVAWMCFGPFKKAQEAFVYAETMTKIVSAMDSFPDDMPLQAHGCRAIARMCEDWEDGQNLVFNNGAFERVVNNLKSKDDYVEECACDALYWMTYGHEPNLRKIKEGDTPLSTKLLQSSIAKHNARLEVNIRGIAALHNLNETRAKVDRTGISNPNFEEIEDLTQDILRDDFGIPPWNPPDNTSMLDNEMAVEI